MEQTQNHNMEDELQEDFIRNGDSLNFMRQYLLADFRQLHSNAVNKARITTGSKPPKMNKIKYNDPILNSAFELMQENLASDTSVYHNHERSFCFIIALGLFLGTHQNLDLTIRSRCEKLRENLKAPNLETHDYTEDDLFSASGRTVDKVGLKQLRNEINFFLSSKDILTYYNKLLAGASDLLQNVEAMKQNVESEQDNIASYFKPEINEYQHCIDLLENKNGANKYVFMRSIYDDNRAPQCICGRCGKDINVKNIIFSRLPKENTGNIRKSLRDLQIGLLGHTDNINGGFSALHTIYASYGCVKPVVCQDPECGYINIVSELFLFLLKFAIVQSAEDKAFVNESLIFYGARKINDVIEMLPNTDDSGNIRERIAYMQPSIQIKDTKTDLLDCNFDDMFTPYTYMSYFSSLNMQKSELVLGNAYECVTRFLYYCASVLRLSYLISKQGFIASLFAWSYKDIAAAAAEISDIANQYAALIKAKSAGSILHNLLCSGIMDIDILNKGGAVLSSSNLQHCFDVLVRSLYDLSNMASSNQSIFSRMYTTFNSCKYSINGTDRFQIDCNKLKSVLHDFLTSISEYIENIFKPSGIFDEACKKLETAVYAKILTDCGQDDSQVVSKSSKNLNDLDLSSLDLQSDSIPFVENCDSSDSIFSTGIADRLFEHMRNYYPIFLLAFIVKTKTNASLYNPLLSCFSIKSANSSKASFKQKGKSEFEVLFSKILSGCLACSNINFQSINDTRVTRENILSVHFEPFVSSEEFALNTFNCLLDSLLDHTKFGYLSFYSSGATVNEYVDNLANVDGFISGGIEPDFSQCEIAKEIYDAANAVTKSNTEE